MQRGIKSEALEQRKGWTFEKLNLSNPAQVQYVMSLNEAKSLLRHRGFSLETKEGIDKAWESKLAITEKLERNTENVDVHLPFRKINMAREKLQANLNRIEPVKGSDDDLKRMQQYAAEKELIAYEATKAKDAADKQESLQKHHECDQPIQDRGIEEDTRRKNLVSSVGFESMEARTAKDELGFGYKDPMNIQEIHDAWNRLITRRDFEPFDLRDPEAVVKILNKARERAFNILPPDQGPAVTQWRISWKKLVEDEQCKFRKYYNIGFIGVGDMEIQAVECTLDLRSLPLLDMKTAIYAWKRVVLPKFAGDPEHPVETIKNMNKAREFLFSIMTKHNPQEKIPIQHWRDTMKQQTNEPDQQEKVDEPLVEEVKSPEHFQQSGEVLAEEPMTQQHNQEQPDDGILALKTQVMAQGIKIEKMESELSCIKQVLEDLLKTVKRSKRSNEDSEDDMSVGSSEMSQVTSDERKTQKRKHTRTEENKEGNEFIDDIKRFFADQFEEKSGAHILCSELYTIFQRSRGEGSELEKNLFKLYAPAHLKEKWPNCKDSRFHKHRCYRNVAVKSDVSNGSTAVPEG